MAKKVASKKSAPKKIIIEDVVKDEKALTASIKLPRKFFIYVAILLIIAGVFYYGRKALFVASVNGQLINRFSVIKDLEKQGGKKVLDTIILKTLINQEASKRKIGISQKEINSEIQKIENNVSSQGSTLDALLVQQGMTKKDLISEIKLQLLVTKMVSNNIKVSDKEINDYLASQKDQTSLGATQVLNKVQAETAIRQQKLQAKIQAFVADLKAKAKINYFVKY